MEYLVLIVPVDSSSELLDVKLKVELTLIIGPTSPQNLFGANISSMVISVCSIAIMVQLIKVHAVLIELLLCLIVLRAQPQIIVKPIDLLNLVFMWLQCIISDTSLFLVFLA